MAEQFDEAAATDEPQQVRVERPKRAKLSEAETLKRMDSFDERKEKFVASVRKGRS